MNVQFHIFSTPSGWMGLAARKGKISRIILPQRSTASCRRLLGKLRGLRGVRTSRNTRVLKEAEKQLLAYLRGKRQRLSFPLDLGGGTDFQQRVWSEARKIPYGKSRSYQWLAGKVTGTREPIPFTARAVGGALGANPLPIVIPCHRIIREDGSLGGFGAGLPRKRHLLSLEAGTAGTARA